MAREEEPEQTEEGPENRADDVRESIWSIRVKHKRLYFRLFTLQIIIGVAWLIRKAVLDESLTGIPDRILSVWQELAPVAIASAVIALVITDTWGTITVLFADWLEDELKKRRQRQIKAAVDKARAEALEEARAEERETARQFRRNLRDWNRRREAAASAGEEFNEPPPGIDLENEDPQREC